MDYRGNRHQEEPETLADLPSQFNQPAPQLPHLPLAQTHPETLPGTVGP